MIINIASILPVRALTDMERPPAGVKLQTLRPSERARILGFSLSRAEIAWLEAVGLTRGDEVEILRRAPFGGPLHVRMMGGGEFALARSLAANIDVLPDVT